MDRDGIAAIIRACCEKLADVIRKLAKAALDFVAKMVKAAEQYLAPIIEAAVDDFIEAHYLLTEHADLVAIDSYLDAWYPELC
ncbi:MAG: hypothetical protein KGL39_48990 [Patescibacteria group bacterium]|nr:hypothetical protein [Patescibacteria group bacterium]